MEGQLCTESNFEIIVGCGTVGFPCCILNRSVATSYPCLPVSNFGVLVNLFCQLEKQDASYGKAYMKFACSFCGLTPVSFF
jgi:hypothetical protein